ncbi:hypothetical protein MNBD_DELTA01-273 [hydrothermal vent metagenome]|uniref:MobA-like NTP transferase domain-containing protein n=1 Tax=hydrothermal vent metagenome TaxID=652676 RepID=A0A3B0QSC3_9ZZZZ
MQNLTANPDNMDKENGVIKGVSCVILVGGESRRIGSDKARVEFRGKKLFTHVFDKVAPLFTDLMISARDEKYPIGALGDIKGGRLVTDHKAAADSPTLAVGDRRRGPIFGLCSALDEARNPWLFMTACDQPLIEPRLIRYLATLRGDFDCVVPVTGGKIQSLFALFNKTCLTALRERIEKAETKKGLSLFGFLEKTEELKIRHVTEEELRGIDPELKSFIDIDTLDELAELQNK